MGFLRVCFLLHSKALLHQRCMVIIICNVYKIITLIDSVIIELGSMEKCVAVQPVCCITLVDKLLR